MDHYSHCEGARVASESPIVSVKPVSEEWFVGGAGLIARQAASLGAKATFVTCCAEDEGLERIKSHLSRFGVEVHNLPVPGRGTYAKTRYLVGGKKVFKVDRGNPSPIPIETTTALIGDLGELLASHDGLIVTDFGYGLFGSTLADAIPRLAANARQALLRGCQHERTGQHPEIQATAARDAHRGRAAICTGRRGERHLQPRESILRGQPGGRTHRDDGAPRLSWHSSRPPSLGSAYERSTCRHWKSTRWTRLAPAMCS